MLITYYGSSWRGTPTTLKEGDIAWSALYDYSYSGNSCSAKIVPIEMKVAKLKGKYVWVRPHNDKYIKQDPRRQYFKTELECKKYYDERLNSHLQSLNGNLDAVIYNIKHVLKQINNKANAKELVKVKKNLQEAIQDLS